ncbi:hypothetical protein [Pseudorhodobacter sp.]|uniref:hypothetical protein n=1 Tax=Pseudorhodobacter sp. TaxID=1934400 RepID=UPI002649E702|nr:hypothetical protein [Pseudorhodobacter sp.]MDN5786944.1 hypothetical protein [Pseudorhodobacter sp.]
MRSAFFGFRLRITATGHVICFIVLEWPKPVFVAAAVFEDLACNGYGGILTVIARYAVDSQTLTKLKSRSVDGKTSGQCVETVAQVNNLKPVMPREPKINPVPYAAQTDESGLDFLTRRRRRTGAGVARTVGNLLVTERRFANAARRQPWPTILLTLRGLITSSPGQVRPKPGSRCSSFIVKWITAAGAPVWSASNRLRKAAAATVRELRGGAGERSFDLESDPEPRPGPSSMWFALARIQTGAGSPCLSTRLELHCQRCDNDG